MGPSLGEQEPNVNVFFIYFVVHTYSTLVQADKKPHAPYETTLSSWIIFTSALGSILFAFDAALVPAATPPITTILFFLLVDTCIGIIDIQCNENLQRFSLKLSSFRIPSIAAYL